MADLNAADIRKVVDRYCDEFESAWRRGEQPDIAGFLDKVPNPARSELCRELIVLELEFSARAGQLPAEEEYLRQYPEHTATIEQSFAEFRNWARATTVVNDELKSGVASSEQDTASQMVETGEWIGRQTGSTVVQSNVDSAFDNDAAGSPDRYDIVRKLGRGGMGSVLLARDRALDRMVAIKLPHIRLEDGPDGIARFHREARAMAAVQHPNLCPIFDVGESGDRPYLAMAYIDGCTLADRIDADGPMKQRQAAHLVRTLALAAHAIHEAGVVHRDLKPSNVMINGDNEPFITDFGLATRGPQNEAELTQSGTVLGSPAYMAPEQVRGDRDAIGPHTDVYALGVILYQLLCGHRPFAGAGLEVLGEITSGKPPALPSAVANVDRALERICLKAMAHRIDERYSSAAELATALESYATQRNPEPRRWPMIAAGVAACLLGLILLPLASGWRPWSSESDKPAPIGDVDPTTVPASAATVLPGTPGLIGSGTGEFLDSGQALVGARSTNVAAGDLDGDGDVDVVVANSEGPNHVWLNDGAGSFEKHQTLPAEQSVDIALGDLDGDGDLDAVFVTWHSADVGSVWLNDGTGRFENADWNPPGEGFFAILMSDVDTDGNPDAVVASHSGPNLVFRNDGTGQLVDSGQRLGDLDSRAIGIGDIDNDGDDDLFVCNYSSQPNTVWLNDGQGNFSDSGQQLGGSKSNGVVLIDTDLDGDLDAYVTNVDGPDSLCINDGAGGFQVTIPFPEVLASGGAGAADLNGDGRMDLMLTHGFRGRPEQARVLLANHEGSGFTARWTLSATSSDVALADFDRDGDVDAFVTNTAGPNQVWFNQNPTEIAASTFPFRFRDSGQELGSAWSHVVVLSDLDGDGHPDAAVANSHSDPSRVWWNDGSGRFSDVGTELADAPSRGLAIGDLDGDGDDDVFLGCENGPNSVWLNDGDRTFRRMEPLIGISNSADVAMADFDGDHDLDVWVGNLNPHDDRVWFNDGSGQFTDSGQLLGTERNWAVNVGDIDGDGDIDVLVGTAVGQRNSLWINDGKGQFARSDEKLSGTTGSNGFAIGDLNGDGAADLFETYYSGQDRVWINDGSGCFRVSEQPLPSLHSKCARLIDLDGDADLDAVVAALNGESSYVLLNDGTGRFPGDVLRFGNSDSSGIAVGDLDGDGDLDAFVANSHGQPNRVWLNEDTSVQD